MTTRINPPDIMAKRFEKNQIDALKAAFGESENLTKDKKNHLVVATGLDVEQIASWFSRRRARKRSREAMAELELEHSRLKQAIKLSWGNEAELEIELQESKIREAELENENQLLRERITVAEGDHHKQLNLLKKWLLDGY